MEDIKFFVSKNSYLDKASATKILPTTISKAKKLSIPTKTASEKSKLSIFVI